MRKCKSNNLTLSVSLKNRLCVRLFQLLSAKMSSIMMLKFSKKRQTIGEEAAIEITGRTHRADPVRLPRGENPPRQRGKPAVAVGSSDWLDGTRRTNWSVLRAVGSFVR